MFCFTKKAACVRKSSLIDLAASILHWKDASFVFPVLQGSAETLLRRGANYTIFLFRAGRFLRKYTFLETFLPKTIISAMHIRVTDKNVGNLFYETQILIFHRQNTSE